MCERHAKRAYGPVFETARFLLVDRTMWESLKPLFEWFDHLWVGQAIASTVPAVLFQFTFFRWVIGKEEAQRSRPLGWLVSVASLVLWFGVGVGGRAIGFV